MPVTYGWTPEQKKQVEEANQWILEALSKSMPGSAYLGQQAYNPVARPIADFFAPTTIEDAMNSALGSIGVGPLELMANYRSPDFIKTLRKAMAQEQKARGQAIKTEYIYTPKRQTIAELQETYPNLNIEEIKKAIGTQFEPDPADLILRGSWFHGMSPKARQEVILNLPRGEAPRIARDLPTGSPELSLGYGYALPATNQYGLPGSTHATPSYVRFGEPYGISLTASPSIAQKFSADEYIHRVMPLYGGSPTERTLQLWKPEHQKRFNEAYNEALNKWIFENQFNIPKTKQTLNEVALVPGGIAKNPIDFLIPSIEGELQYSKGTLPSAFDDWLNKLQAYAGAEPMSKFNTMFSDALKSQGTRGLLYNPRRYGEYEMLMLDPQWALPLDYRKLEEYIKPLGKIEYETLPGIPSPVTRQKFIGTPKMRMGYELADPEFAANHARLSEMFNLMPWTERISQENWNRILQQVDPAFRDAIVNQLFGNR